MEELIIKIRENKHDKSMLINMTNEYVTLIIGNEAIKIETSKFHDFMNMATMFYNLKYV